jgi:hypothetical protein
MDGWMGIVVWGWYSLCDIRVDDFTNKTSGIYTSVYGRERVEAVMLIYGI